uniref:Uncharacterized protein n=1 Tax=Oryza nivara TaxID=4536 RepID=A0A0E0H3K5_ORYNI
MEPRDYRVNSIKSLAAGPLQCHATIPWAVGPAFWSYGIIAVMRFHPAGWESRSSPISIKRNDRIIVSGSRQQINFLRSPGAPSHHG